MKSFARTTLRLSLYGLLFSMGLYLSCGPVLNEPTVLNLSLSDSTISKNETGSSSSTLKATITVTNFSQPLEETIQEGDTYIFLQDSDREAQGSVEVQGNSTIVITGIAYTWLQGLSTGMHQVGVQVTTDKEEVRQLDMETIEITDN